MEVNRVRGNTRERSRLIEKFRGFGIRRGECGNARARAREQVEGKERKSKKRFVGSQRGRVALGTTKSRRRLARSPLFSPLVSSNLTPSSLCRRQMPDSIGEIPKAGPDREASADERVDKVD